MIISLITKWNYYLQPLLSFVEFDVFKNDNNEQNICLNSNNLSLIELIY